MDVTFKNTGEKVNLTSAGTTAKYQYPIGAGISQPITITDVSTFTSVKLTYFQNGNELKAVSIPTRLIMNIDLSIFSSLTQSLPESFKEVSGTLYRMDVIIIEAFTGTTLYGFMRVGVSNVGSKLLGGYPGFYNNGNMWTGSNSLGIATGGYNTTLAKVQTDGMGWPDACRITASSTGTLVTPEVIIRASNYDSLPFTTNGFSFGLWLWNDNAKGGYVMVFKVYVNGSEYYSTTIAPQEGGLYKFEDVKVSGTGNKVEFRVKALAGNSLRIFYSRLQFNEGGTLRNWSPNISEVTNDDNTKKYGFLTDYADGYKVNCEDYIATYSPLTGYPFQDRVFWGSAQPNTATADLAKYLKVDSNANVVINQGHRVNYQEKNLPPITRIVILNKDGTNVYGRLRYRNVPNLPPPNCRVCVNWLNSYGTYDTLYALDYKVTPTLTMQGTDGNKLNYYDTVITVPVTENNERALEILMRSQHVRAIIPNQPFQWGAAEIVGNNLSYYAGGSTTKLMTVRMRVTTIGNL